MSYTSRTLCWLAVGVAALLSFGPTGAAAKYPARPITLICPWGAGGGTDAVSRMVATLLKKELGVPVNVVNRTGGGGAVGHTAMATARPDGYTIGMPTVELTMIHWMGLSKITYRDIAPVAMVNFDPAGISVRADSPWASYEELAAHIRANPGRLQASGSGRGGIWHLALAGWMKALGLEANAVKWIPSKGAAPALQDLMAGGIELGTCSLPETSTLVDAGKVRPLAIMAADRDPNFPEVPTLEETGAAWTCGAWRGIAAPKGTPQEILEVLEKAVTKVVQSAEFTEFMENRGFGIYYLDAAGFAQALARADSENGETMRAAGIVK